MPSSPFRLVAIDLDGTLLDSRYQISAANRQAIRDLQDAGIQVVLATGRRFGMGIAYAESLGLDGPMIFQNGAVIKDLATRLTIAWRGLPANLVRAIVSLGHELGFSAILFVDPHGVGRVLLEDRPERYFRLKKYIDSRWSDAALVRDCRDHGRLDILQVLFCGGVVAIRELAEACRRRFGDDARRLLTEYPDRDLSLLDLMHWNVSKGEALRRVACLAGLTREATAAIGDNFNDREMLAAAGLAMVMGNADPALQAEFPTVLPPHTTDGVAWGVWRHLLPRPERLAEYFPPPRG